ncbi:hypothetical protein BGW37DRAFT_468783 [Umbelopsis sp. PMI_123]|nr:hypothetical protein BGW37DRAFT_468783 [Umbelopsis sp. PMI_123]
MKFKRAYHTLNKFILSVFGRPYLKIRPPRPRPLPKPRRWRSRLMVLDIPPLDVCMDIDDPAELQQCEENSSSIYVKIVYGITHSQKGSWRTPSSTEPMDICSADICSVSLFNSTVKEALVSQPEDLSQVQGLSPSANSYLRTISCPPVRSGAPITVYMDDTDAPSSESIQISNPSTLSTLHTSPSPIHPSDILQSPAVVTTSNPELSSNDKIHGSQSPDGSSAKYGNKRRQHSSPEGPSTLSNTDSISPLLHPIHHTHSAPSSILIPVLQLPASLTSLFSSAPATSNVVRSSLLPVQRLSLNFSSGIFGKPYDY